MKNLHSVRHHSTLVFAHARTGAGAARQLTLGFGVGADGGTFQGDFGLPGGDLAHCKLVHDSTEVHRVT